jgi:hypothetical protein
MLKAWQVKMVDFKKLKEMLRKCLAIWRAIKMLYSKDVKENASFCFFSARTMKASYIFFVK